MALLRMEVAGLTSELTYDDTKAQATLAAAAEMLIDDTTGMTNQQKLDTLLLSMVEHLRQGAIDYDWNEILEADQAAAQAATQAKLDAVVADHI